MSTPAPDPDMPSPTVELQCPTCGARQAWSDTCRRCKSDLSLVLQVQQRLHALRQQCLQELRAQRLGASLRTAQRCYQLSAAPLDARLLAVCHLLSGHWAAALACHDQAVAGTSAPSSRTTGGRGSGL